MRSSGRPRAARVAAGIDACLVEFAHVTQKDDEENVRHSTGHTDQRIDAAKTDTDGPQPCTGNDAFADVLVACSKTQNCTITDGNAFVNIAVGMVGETRIESGKPEGIKVVCDKGCGL